MSYNFYKVFQVNRGFCGGKRGASTIPAASKSNATTIQHLHNDTCVLILHVQYNVRITSSLFGTSNYAAFTTR